MRYPACEKLEIIGLVERSHLPAKQTHRTLAPHAEEPDMVGELLLPCDLEKQIEAFVEHYNHQHYHERLNNLTPADVYFGHGQSILAKRARIKRKTIAKRRLHYQRRAA